MTDLLYNPISTTAPQYTQPVSFLDQIDEYARPNPLARSTIQSHPEAESPQFIPSKPKLTPPTYYDFCHKLCALENTAFQILNVRKDTVQRIQETEQSKYTALMDKMDEAIKNNQKRSWWGWIHKLLSLASFVLSGILGIGVCTTGAPIVGGFMIAAAVLSIFNFVLEETKTWDYIAEKYANGNLEQQRRLAFLIPTAIGLVASVGAFFFSQVNALQQVGLALKSIMDLIQSGVNLKEGFLNKEMMNFRAEEKGISHEIDFLNDENEELSELIKSSMERLKIYREEATKAITTAIETIDCTIRG